MNLTAAQAAQKFQAIYFTCFGILTAAQAAQKSRLSNFSLFSCLTAAQAAQKCCSSPMDRRERLDRRIGGLEKDAAGAVQQYILDRRIGGLETEEHVFLYETAS